MTRLRTGTALLLAGGVGVLVSLFLPFYRLGGGLVQFGAVDRLSVFERSGWSVLHGLDVLLAVVAVAAVGLGGLAVARMKPTGLTVRLYLVPLAVAMVLAAISAITPPKDVPVRVPGGAVIGVGRGTAGPGALLALLSLVGIGAGVAVGGTARPAPVRGAGR